MLLEQLVFNKSVLEKGVHWYAFSDSFVFWSWDRKHNDTEPVWDLAHGLFSVTFCRKMSVVLQVQENLFDSLLW